MYLDASHSAAIQVGNNSIIERGTQANSLVGPENSKTRVALLADGVGGSSTFSYEAEHTDSGSLMTSAICEAIALPSAEQGRLAASSVASSRSITVESTETKATIGDVASNTFPGAGQYGVVLIGTPSGNVMRVVPMVANPATGNFQYVV